MSKFLHCYPRRRRRCHQRYWSGKWESKF